MRFLSTRHRRRGLGAAGTLALVLLGLGFTLAPAQADSVVYVPTDITPHAQCSTWSVDAQGQTSTHRPCAVGTVWQLMPLAASQAKAKHLASTNDPQSEQGKQLLTTVASVVPKVICAVQAFCGGGGGTTGPCSQHTTWLSYDDGHTGVEGWVSFSGDSACQTFQVYSDGFRMTHSSVAPGFWPLPWRAGWNTDNGQYVGYGTLPTTSYVTRAPYYWVGTGGAREVFTLTNSWNSYDQALQFSPF